MKDYTIIRIASGEVGCIVREWAFGTSGWKVLRYPLVHCVVHSPAGFECGYHGSGPADLALSILADWFGESKERVERTWKKSLGYNAKNRALLLHQQFKADFIAEMKLEPGESQTIPDFAIRKWLEGKPVVWVPRRHARYLRT